MNTRVFKCPLHSTDCTNICLALNCDSRMVCAVCYQSHNGNHLSQFIPVENLLNETIRGELIGKVKEAEELISNDREEIERVFSILEGIVVKEVGVMRSKVISKLQNENSIGIPSSKKITNLFKSLQIGKPTSEELDFLSSTLLKSRSIEASRIEFNAELLNQTADDMKQKILEIEAAFTFKASTSIDFERLNKVLEIQSPGKSLVSSPFDLRNDILVIGCSDTGLVDIYQLIPGTPLIGRLQNNGGKVLAVKVIPETDHIIVAGVTIINVFKHMKPNQPGHPHNFFLEKVYTGHSKDKFIYSMDYLEASGIMLSGGNDKKLRVWRLCDLVDSQILDLGSEIGIVRAFESHVLTGTKSGEVFYFKSSSKGKLFFHFSHQCHSDWICSLDFNIKKSHILTGSNDCTMKLWSLNSEASQLSQIKEFNIKSGFVRDVKLLMNSEISFCVSFQGKASFISIESGQPIKEIEEDIGLTSAFLQIEKKFLLLGTSEGKVLVYSW